MGCGCQGAKTKPQNYVYTSPQGKKITYKTEVEARAAQIRANGGTYQVVAR